jgi:serine/threonine protein phosphatase PrpC
MGVLAPDRGTERSTPPWRPAPQKFFWFVGMGALDRRQSEKGRMIGRELEFYSCGATDIGQKRQINEDSFLCDDELGLWVVADGMGGHAAGEVASREAVDTIHGMVKRDKLKLELVSGDLEETLRVGARLLEGAVQAATYLVYGMAELDSNKAGMGTTISAMMSLGTHAVTAQVGDSRIYRLRNSIAEQLTEDHTLINWQIKQGLITEEEARMSRHRNVITRAVGNREYVQVDTAVLPVSPGDQFLLCSDGLYSYLRTDEISSVANSGGQASVDRFIKLANRRGGRDNITAVLVEIG